MKKTLILTFALVLTLTLLNAQESVIVPDEVIQTFKQKFPEARAVLFNNENEEDWHVEFQINRKEYDAFFSPNGKWLETYYEIDETDIPDTIKEILNTEFPELIIKQIEIAENNQGLVYELSLEKGEVEWCIDIDKEGNVLSKEVIEDEDE